MGILRKIMGDPDKAKVVVKTHKAGPIRKVKMAIGAGTLAMILSPLIEPWLLSWLGHVPEGLVNKIAETLITNYELLSALGAAYMARPDQSDGPVVDGKGIASSPNPQP